MAEVEVGDYFADDAPAPVEAPRCVAGRSGARARQDEGEIGADAIKVTVTNE